MSRPGIDVPRRLGSAYGVAESRHRLRRLAYLEDRLATACAGWIWTTLEWDDKLRLAVLAYESSAAADALLARSDELAPSTAERQWDLELADLEQLANSVENAVGLAARLGGAAALLTRLRDAYAEHLAATDDLTDGPTSRLLRALAQPTADRLALCAAEPRLPALPDFSPPQRFLVDAPARDGRFDVATFDGYRVHEMGVTAEEVVRHLLYTNAYGELEAVEVLGRALADARELPWAMRRDLFRQLWDEERHAEMSWRRMEDLGGAPEPLPPAPPVILGVMAEIDDPIERLLVLQRVIEGRVVERHRLRVSTVARDLGDPVTARMYEYIVADERQHVGNSEWIPKIVGDDPARIARLERLQTVCEAKLEEILARRVDQTAGMARR
jgi:uncharacterized ferritin-like protein (DUF455 family)